MGFDQLENRARRTGPTRIAVVGAHDINILRAVARATREGIGTAVLIGDESRILRLAEGEGIDLTSQTIKNIKEPEKAARFAMSLVNSNQVFAIMKGKIATSLLMQTLLTEGIRRAGRLLSHVAGIEHPKMGKHRLVILTDAGLIPYPTLDQRVSIIQNAVEVARLFGVSEPRTALLSLTEEVSDQIPASQHAAKLKEMNGTGGPLDGFGVIDGPMDIFCALDAEIANLKGVTGRVAGAADILHCPDAVAGNMMSKGIIYFAPKARTGGAVVGGRVPVILLSRASSAEDKYCSLLLGISCRRN